MIPTLKDSDTNKVIKVLNIIGDDEVAIAVLALAIVHTALHAGIKKSQLLAAIEGHWDKYQADHQ